MEESGAPGCQGRDKHFEGKPQKRKAGGFKVSAQVFQREQKTGAIPLLKHDSSRAGRELGGGGWQGISVRERKLIICWLRSRMPSVFVFVFVLMNLKLKNSEEATVTLRI